MMIDKKFLKGKRVDFLELIRSDEEGLHLWQSYVELTKLKETSSILTLGVMEAFKLYDLSSFGGAKPKESDLIKYKKRVCKVLGEEHMNDDFHTIKKLADDTKKEIDGKIEGIENGLEDRFKALYETYGFSNITSLEILSMKRKELLSSEQFKCVLLFDNEAVFTAIASKTKYDADCFTLECDELPYQKYFGCFEKITEDGKEFFRVTKKSNEVDKKILEDMIDSIFK